MNWLLLAQIITFIPQPPSLPALDQYTIIVCNKTDATMTVSYGQVAIEAMVQGIPLVSRVNLLAEMERTQRKSPERKLILALEAGAWIATGLMTTETIKIKERWKAALPGFAAILRIATTVAKQHVHERQLPSDLVPSLFQVPAGGCQEYTVFSTASP